MGKIDKNFNISLLVNLKDLYEQWGHDFTSMLNNFKKDFPNAVSIYSGIYGIDKSLDLENDDVLSSLRKILYEKSGKTAKDTIGELIFSKISNSEVYAYNIYTKHLNKKYSSLNICEHDKYVETYKCDGILPILAFFEDVVEKSAYCKIVTNKGGKVIIKGYNTLEISEENNLTKIKIIVNNIMEINYHIVKQ